MAERRIPDVLWVGLIALGIMVLAQFALSLRLGVGLFVGAALGALLLLGLYCGHRWAYVLVVATVPLKLILIIAMGRGGYGLLILALDCLVLIPVLMSTAYFWPRWLTGSGDRGIVCSDTTCGHENRSDSRYCARCGRELTEFGARLETPA